MGTSALSALVLGTSAPRAETFAVVEVQRAVIETDDGRRAQATLKKLFDRRQQELDKKQSTLRSEREDIEKQARILSRRALQRRTDQWQRQMIELQSVFVDYNKELQQKQNELTGPIVEKVMRLIRRIATRRGIDMVLDKQAAPYIRADLDLTDMVVQMYGQGEDGEGDAKDSKASKPESLP